MAVLHDTIIILNLTGNPRGGGNHPPW